MSTTAVETRAPVWRRLIGFNLLTGIIFGIVGYYLGWFLGHHITGRASTTSATSIRTTSP